MLKKIIPLLGILFVPSIGYADSTTDLSQCNLMPMEYEDSALEWLKNGASFVSWCQLCEELAPGEVQHVESVTFEVAPDNYRRIILNGERVDAAYVYVYHNRVFRNLGKYLNCNPVGVSDAIYSFSHVLDETRRLNREADLATLAERRAQ
tara:strand:+ start:1525 stop:1974 length:450 start_codon:yes stop_codon:yes gene_type:complete